MPEVRRPVNTYEVNYVCDKCGHGMLKFDEEAGSGRETGENPHACLICGHKQSFKGVTYPRIIHLHQSDGPGESES